MQQVGKIVLTVEIAANGQTIGDKENVAAALERFGKVTILKVEERTQQASAHGSEADYWRNYVQGSIFENRIRGL